MHVPWARRKMRILAAGGDGTVAWILKTVRDLDLRPEPGVAVMPLGTGNDLSLSFGWGNTFMRAWISVRAPPHPGSTLKSNPRALSRMSPCGGASRHGLVHHQLHTQRAESEALHIHVSNGFEGACHVLGPPRLQSVSAAQGAAFTSMDESLLERPALSKRAGIGWRHVLWLPMGSLN